MGRGKVVSFEFYAIGSDQLTSFAFDDIKSVRIINEELTPPTSCWEMTVKPYP
jgi:hypothetical protein